MKAIILAAGQGTRLRPYTDDRPKCLVELAGKTLLDRQVATLQRAGISDILVLGGYRADQLPRPGIRIALNPRFATTNMVVSLFCAAHEFDGTQDLLICYGDIVYESKVLQALLDDTAPQSTAIDLQWQALWELRMEDPLKDAETLKLDAQGNIIELGNKPTSLSDIEGQYIGLIKVTAGAQSHWLAAYERLLRERGEPAVDAMFMTSFLQYLIDTGHPLKAATFHGGWIEVDTVADLDTYHARMTNGTMQTIYRPDA